MLANDQNYYFDADSETNRDFADFTIAKEPFEHTYLKKKLTKLKEGCRRACVAVISSPVDVVDFFLGRVLDSVTGDVSTYDSLWHNESVIRRLLISELCSLFPMMSTSS